VQAANKDFGGGASGTILHPIVAVATVVIVVLTLLLPRKYVIVPFLLGVLLIPLPQQLYVAGVHLFIFRILILAGWIRMLWTKISSNAQIFSGGVNVVDRLFFWWAIFRATSPIVLMHFASGEVIFQFGFLWDAIGGYFFLRFLIQDKNDIFRTIKTCVGIVTVLSVTMLGERIMHQNVIGYLGGIPIAVDIREGSIRSHGSFAVSITAGVFGATLLCLFVLLWKIAGSKSFAIAGLIGATVITITSASSTPLLAYLGGILAICFWPMRKSMRPFRWGIVVLLITLHLIMKAPVWFLIAHVDVVAGNSGYHRAMLIDTFIRHFWDWWLVGTNDAINWGFDMWDLSNQFVAEGETGGLVAFIFFILIISKSFGRIGTARKLIEGDTKNEWLLWLLGATLFAHCVAYFGISYFDQIKISWFLLLVMISVTTAPILAAGRLPEDSAPKFMSSRPFSPRPESTVTGLPSADAGPGLPATARRDLKHQCFWMDAQ
jgi:hypothetical protein